MDEEVGVMEEAAEEQRGADEGAAEEQRGADEGAAEEKAESAMALERRAIAEMAEEGEEVEAPGCRCAYS